MAMKTLFDLATWLYPPNREVGEATSDSELFTKITKTIADFKTQTANLKQQNNKANQLIEAIAAQLGIDFNGNTEQIHEIHEAIAYLKREPNRVEYLKSLNEIRDANEFLVDLSRQLHCDRRSRDAVFEAIAELKIKARYKPNDEEKTELIKEIQGANELIAVIALELNLNDFEDTELLDRIKEWRLTREAALICARNKNASLEAIAERLGIKFTGNTDDIYEAIAKLKKSGHREDYWHTRYNDLQVLYDQAWNTPVDRDELQSERDYYRGILDKLCDRMKVADIEALEHVAKHQEMNVDFISQNNDVLRQQLAESQAVSYKYVSRIVELENEVRSLQEPSNTTGCGDRPVIVNNFECDRLTTTEYVQTIKTLLKAIPV